MSMPEGKKFTHGYSTVEDGMGYREISEEMTRRGDKMGHSHARSVFIKGMSKFADGLGSLINENTNYLDSEEVARDPRFQSAIAAYLRMIEW